MNVVLPDGTTVANVPEGTTKADLLMKLKAGGHDVPPEWFYASGKAPKGVVPTEPGLQPVRIPVADWPAEAVQSTINAFKPQTPQPTSLGKAAGDVASSTAAGGALGYAAPQLLKKGGELLQKGRPIPVIGPRMAGIGEAMQGAGEMLQAAPAIGRTLSGATSGGAAGAVDVAGKALGAPPAFTLGAELLAGGGVPELHTVTHLISHPYLTVSKYVHGIVARLRARPLEQAVQDVHKLIREGEMSGVPAEQLHQAIHQGLMADHAEVTQQADAVLTQAHEQASQLEKTYQQRADDILKRSQERSAAAQAQAETIRAADKAKADKLLASVKKIQADAQTRIAVLQKDAEAQKAQIMDAAKAHAESLHKDALNKAEAIHQRFGSAFKQKVGAASATDINAIGAPQELSDIGAELRNSIVSQQTELTAKRQTEYKAAQLERDKVVAAKEAKGQKVNGIPSFTSFEKMLSGLLGRNSHGAMVTSDPSLRNLYASTLKSIRGEQNEDGTYSGVTFNALDQIRRKFGEAWKGNPPQGYEAISNRQAKEFYNRLDKIQKDFAGEAQTKLQDVYKENSNQLSAYMSNRGKKAYAQDQFNDAEYLTDAKALPSTYFKSKEKVQELRHLVRNNALVDQAAASYVAQELKGADSKAVLSYLRNPQNSDWIRTIPGLGKKIESYGNALARAEAIQKRSADILKKQQERAIGAPRAAIAAGEKVMSTAEKQAAEVGKAAEEGVKAEAATAKAAGKGEKKAQSIVQQSDKAYEKAVSAANSDISNARLLHERYYAEGRTAGEAVRKEGLVQHEKMIKESLDRAKSILTSETPAESIRALFTRDPNKNLSTIAKYLTRTPEGKKVFEKALRQHLANMSPSSATQLWNMSLRSAIEGAGIMDVAAVRHLDTQINDVLKAMHGAPVVERLGLVKRMVLGAIGGQVAQVPSAVAGALPQTQAPSVPQVTPTTKRDIFANQQGAQP